MSPRFQAFLPLGIGRRSQSSSFEFSLPQPISRIAPSTLANDVIDNHTAHRCLPARGRNAEESPRWLPRHAKPLHTLSSSDHHLLNYPVNVRKRSAERGNHLLKVFAPQVLAGEGIEFNKIKGHEIVHRSWEYTLTPAAPGEVSSLCH